EAFSYFTPDGSGSDINATYGGTNVLLGDILDITLEANGTTVMAGEPPGSQVRTHALVEGSPAIDKAPDASCTVAPINGVDERNKLRNFDGDLSASLFECDIGAFEVHGFGPNAVSLQDFAAEAGGGGLAGLAAGMLAALAVGAASVRRLRGRPM
ncbi:MAG: hypothetical protein GY831_10355, partial [Delftia sp.]|nr:hypothetical protein [Delftia sp.]